MKRFLLLALVCSVMLTTAPVLADGDFYVIAGGGGVGTKITSLPYTISQSGFYYLGGNLTHNGTGNAIIVNADDVTIDLMGFSLSRNSLFFISNGIYMNGRTNVEIRNGTVRGFFNGICEAGAGNYHRVSNVRAINNSNCGISLSSNHSDSSFGSGDHMVQGCIASGNVVGIYVEGSGMITGCVASFNSHGGICLWGPGSVIGNIAKNNADYNFQLNSTYNQVVDRNSADGLIPGNNYAGVGAHTAMGVNAGAP